MLICMTRTLRKCVGPDSSGHQFPDNSEVSVSIQICKKVYNSQSTVPGLQFPVWAEIPRNGVCVDELSENWCAVVSSPTVATITCQLFQLKTF